MKIINIESIGDGYKGFLTEDYIRYSRFSISPYKYLIIPIKTSSKISGYEEFIDIWSQCNQSTKFLKPPVEIKELTFDRLKEIQIASPGCL